MGRPDRRLGLTAFEWVCIVIVGLFAGAATVALLNYNMKYLLVLVGGLLFLLAISLSGNPRLFFLYGLVVSAPLDLSKRFMVIAHMGGASAIRIDVMDLFMIPLLVFLFRDYRFGYKSGFRLPAPFVYWLIFAGLGMYFIAVGPYRHLAFLEVFRMLKLAVLGFVVVHEVLRRKQMEHLLTAMLLSLILQSLIGILEYVKGSPLGLYALGEATPEVIDVLAAATLEGGAFVYRISALLGHSNLFSIFLASQLPIAFAVLFTGRGLWLKVVSTVALGTGGCALILTLSRTGWATAAVSMASVMVMSLFHPALRARFIVGRIAMVLGGAVILLAFSKKILSRLLHSDANAVDVRLEWIEVAYDMWLEKPVFGWGLNTFVYQMVPYTQYQSLERLHDVYGEVLPVVHNVYALILAEQGIVGILTFLVFVISLIIMAARNLAVKDEFVFAMAIASFSGLFVYILDWLASFSLKMPTNGRLLFIQLGLICAIHFWRQANEVQSSSNNE